MTIHVPYAPNTTRWKTGDLVIHDCDAKKAYMLMTVLGYDRKTGECITRYTTPSKERFGTPDRGIYRNDIKHLLDPASFGIAAEVSHD